VPPKEEPLDPNREPVIEPAVELRAELPLNDEDDPEREPPIDELPKCEPSMFETPRFGEIVLREPSMLLRPASDDPLLRLPVWAFDATEGAPEPDRAVEPALDPRDAPAEGALPAELPAFPPACAPAVLPVLGPRALPLLPENECQLPSAFARVAPRPAGHPDVRAFNEFERPALELAPFRAFAEALPPERLPFALLPFERPPPYAPPERP
jgi:hypothetical protein